MEDVMKKRFWRKLFAVSLSVAMLATGFSLNGFNSKALLAATIKTGSDFTAEAVDTSSSVCTLKFKANNYAQYVIAHYKVNDGGLNNVMMSSSNGYDFSYDIKNLSKGTKITVSFTYNKGNAQYDTSEATYTTGSSSSTSGSVAAPFGVVAEDRGNNQMGVVWGNGGAESYNIYIDDYKVASGVGCGYYVITNVSAGKHTVAISANSGSNESAKTSVTVNVTGASTATTAKPTTKAPTTVKATTKAQETNGVVTVYQDINYGGNAVSLPVGDYNMNDLISRGFKNDDMSSIKVADGYQAIIYWDINFGGASKTITSNTSWIGSDWNDQMTSIKVQKKAAATQATTKASSNTNTGWTVVPASDNKVYYKDANNISIVNVQQPGFASSQGVYATTSTAIDHININGSRASSSQVAIQGAGAIVYLSAIAKSDTVIQYCDGSNNVIGSVTYKNDAGSSSSSGGGVEPTQSSNTGGSGNNGGSGSSGTTFTRDSSLPKPFGLVLSNPDDGIISVVWGAGNINCYNVYVDGVRKRTKVQAGVQQIPVQTAGKHTVSIATVSGTSESDWESMDINVNGTAPPETTDYPIEKKPQRDTSLQKQSGKMILQMNNKTNGKYSDSQIYWSILGRNSSGTLCYLDTSGNLVPASTGLNNGTIAGRTYAKAVIHTMAEKRWVNLPAMSSGRMYISYGEPVYLNFVQGADGGMGYAGPDVNNAQDPNANTLFEYFEFTTEAVNGGITFHGNTTRVDFFSFPYMIRLMDEYGGFDRCVGDIGTRDEIFNAYKNEVPNAFKGLANDKRIMAPCKTLFNEGQQYGNYFQDYIDRFWSKYTNEDLVFACEGGTFRGRVEGNRMKFSKDGSGAYYVSKPNTQEVLEGKGAFAQGSVVEKVIEAQLCAAFNRGVAMTPQNYNKPSTYYKTDSIYNAYAGFFHNHSVSNKAYGFCYDDVNDQSTLVETGNADALVIDLKW